ncbi:MAG: hypothetical protein GX829_03050 [Clostridium sp.]|jgi:hypothetical protein|nr:hypothetical protein [Clostridium sp.]
MSLREIISAFLWIAIFSSFGISILSFWTFNRMKSVPKNERNLLEYQKPHQYTNLGFTTLAIGVISLIVALWL